MRVFPKLTKARLRIFGGPSVVEPSSGKTRVLFVSHEATRTGAPMIILNLLKQFSEKCDIQCETILHNGGQLASEFSRHSRVDCINVPRKPSDELKKKVSKIVQRERDNPPVLAVCNSMESRFIAEELAAAGIPIIFLVHELPSSYSEEDYQNVYNYSEKIIFPAQAVREAADKKNPIPQGKSVVLPQGLLNPDFGKSLSREEARTQIRQELNLPENSFVVLGCGTLDMRKGIDHFAAIARRTVQQTSEAQPIHFVWLGEGPRWTHSPYHYVQLDLEKSKAQHRVHFIGERANVEPFFLGADTFLMSSRVDPFPCVIHEAMASGLPILTFANNGGAAEAISGGAGMPIPYADYEQAAAVIRMIQSQPELAQGMREKSKERVHTKYRFEDYGDKVIDLGEAVSKKILRTEKPQLRVVRAAA